MTEVVRAAGAPDAIDGRWIVTFVVAELVGLGGIVLVGAHLGDLVERSPLGSIALGAAVGVLGGGLVAGLLGRRLRARHAPLERRRWACGTVAGGVLACGVAAVVLFLRVVDPGVTAGPGPIRQPRRPAGGGARRRRGGAGRHRDRIHRLARGAL